MWVKVDDGFPDHRKVFTAGRLLGRAGAGTGRALAIWLEGMCYANRMMTDGFIPLGVAETMRHDTKPLQVADALAKAGLWEPVDGGWHIHDYHDFNPTPEEIEEMRDKKVRAGREGGLQSGRIRGGRGKQMGKQNGSSVEAPASNMGSKREARASDAKLVFAETSPVQKSGLTGTAEGEAKSETRAVSQGSRDTREAGAQANAKQNSSSRARDPDPDPSTPCMSPLEGSALVDAFDQLYRAYPNKARKREAIDAWLELGPSADLAARILADVRHRVAAGWVRTEARFVPQLRNYLQGRMWEDDASGVGPPADDADEFDRKYGTPIFECATCGGIHHATRDPTAPGGYRHDCTGEQLDDHSGTGGEAPPPPAPEPEGDDKPYDPPVKAARGR